MIKVLYKDKQIRLENQVEMYVYTDETLKEQKWVPFDMQLWINSNQWAMSRYSDEYDFLYTDNSNNGIIRFKLWDNEDSIYFIKSLIDISNDRYKPKSFYTENLIVYNLNSSGTITNYTSFINFIPTKVNGRTIEGQCDWVVIEN